jgi:hypothetical protein
MFGFENSNLEDIDLIIQFILENKIDAEVSRLTPYPSTKLYEDLKKDYEHQYGKLHATSSISEWGKIIKHLSSKSGLSDEEITEGIVKVYLTTCSEENYRYDHLMPLGALNM